MKYSDLLATDIGEELLNEENPEHLLASMMREMGSINLAFCLLEEYGNGLIDKLAAHDNRAYKSAYCDVIAEYERRVESNKRSEKRGLKNAY